MKKLMFFIVLSLVSAGCKGNGEKVQPMQEDGQEVRDTMRVVGQTEQEVQNDEQLPLHPAETSDKTMKNISFFISEFLSLKVIKFVSFWR